MRFQTPLDFSSARYSGWGREHWEEAFFQMMIAIMSSASPSGARQRLPGPRSHHGRDADEVEGFSRSFIMAGPWLHNSSDGVFHYNGEKYDVAAFYRTGILAGTDPSHPEYWGDLYDYAQHLVELASVSWALYQGKKHIWDRFTESEKEQVASYLYQCTKVTYHHNNWLLFNVVTNTVLKKLGQPYSQQQIDANLEACDHMYIGEGWYRDGDVNRIDYYNAWGFLYYYLIWVILDGESKPELAKKHTERARLFVRDFRYFFAKDGGVPAFGRSMIYRFGYLSVVALGQYLDILDIDVGQVRSMMSLGTKFYLDQPIFTDSMHLSMGYIRSCATILEHYSCGGSPYWAVKAFNILMLPKTADFWLSDEAKLPIHHSDYCRSLDSAGLHLVGSMKSGHVQIINQKSRHDKAEYNAKYTKFAYSSEFAYESRPVWGNYHFDNVLQFSEDRISYRQRWKMKHYPVSDHLSLSSYALHEVDEEGTGLTAILIKDGVYISFHRISPTKNLRFVEGGYALGFDQGEPEIISLGMSQYASVNGRISFIKGLYGWQESIPARPFNDDLQSTNVRYSRSAVPSLVYDMEREELKGEDIYLASMVAGRVSTSESIHQLDSLVQNVERSGEEFTIRFHDSSEYRVSLAVPDSGSPQ